MSRFPGGRSGSPAARMQDAARTVAAPRAKVLGGELAPGEVPEVRVDVAGIDRLALPVGIDVLEQLVSRQVLAAPDDARETRVADVDAGERTPRSRRGSGSSRAVG